MPGGNRKQVGLLLESHQAGQSRVLSGLAQWMQNNPGWQMAVFAGDSSRLAQVAREWDGDGMVVAFDGDSFHETVAARGIPVVNLSASELGHGGTAVLVDEAACGRLAAEHFLDRGFRHFGFVGSGEAPVAQRVARAFAERTAAADRAATMVEAPSGTERALAGWLRGQARPLAVVASSDPLAASILEACHLAGLNVPEEVAVLGMGNQLPLCELCTPALSSLDCNPARRGFEAAALLERLMDGETLNGAALRIPPSGVVTRRSTDTFAFHDAELGKALRFIHDNAHRSIKVQDVLAATSISRRSLENRFRRLFHRSLHEEIWRAHFERAKQLLSSTDLGLQGVAERSGFRTASALANLFRQRTGLTPRTYRARNRR